MSLETHFTAANAASAIVYRLAGDDAFAARFESALMRGDLNGLSETLGEIGADESALSFGVRNGGGETQGASTVTIKCKKCTITIETNN